MASLEEYAALSSHVYGGKPLPSGWAPVLMADGFPVQAWRESGYYGALFQKTDTGEYALVSRGTELDDAGDRRADLAMARGLIPQAQFEHAQEFLSFVETQGIPRDQITLAGHSLGGSLSQLLAASYDMPAVTFNAFPMKRMLAQLGLDSDAPYRITDVVDSGDPVSHMGPHIGTRVELAADQLPLSALYAPPLGEHADLYSLLRYFRSAHDIDGLVDKIGTAKETSGPCPVVLDLDGDGIETTSLQAGAFFDHDANGFAEQSGWIEPDDGLLAMDRDGDGRIGSGRELFGNHTLLASGAEAANGYVALAELDANRDGRVDAGDPAFGALRVWTDSDRDGVAADDELHTLGELGIRSVATSYQESAAVDPHGNALRQIGTFTRDDGSTGTSVDAWFLADGARTIAGQWVDVPPAIAALPDACGFGTVRDLRQAMAQDVVGGLTALVAAFVAQDDPHQRSALIEPILFAWTGSQAIDPGSRGPAMDARRLAVLEQFSGEPYVGVGGLSDPNVNAAVILEDAYRDLCELVYGQLMVQSHMSILDRMITYRWDEASQSLRGDLSAVQTELDARLAADLESGRSLLGELARVVRGLQAESMLEYWDFREHFARQGEDLAWAMDSAGRAAIEGTADADALFGGHGADALRGGAGSDSLSGGPGPDVLYGSAGNDVLLGEDADDLLVGGGDGDDLSGGAGADRLEGGDGADRLYGDAGDDMLLGDAGADVLAGGDGADRLDGGPGDDTLEGGFGDDTYVFRRGGGQDIVNDADWQIANLDRVLVEPGIAPEDLTVSREGDDLLLRLNGSADDMRLRGWFLEGFGSEFQVQRVEFADGTVWDVTLLKQMVLNPTTGPDFLVGYGGADTIAGLEGDDEIYGRSGDDSLDGGPGADRLYGEAGGDLLLGGADADQLWGGDGDDLLAGGSGPDTLNGGFGNDTYLFGRGASQDTVIDNDWQVPSTDRILVGADVVPADLDVSRSGNDLLLQIRGTADQMWVRDWFLEGFASAYQVQQVEFADGTVWDVAMLRAMAAGGGTDGPDTLVGSDAADMLFGGGGDDTLYGRGGDDRLDGGPGTDRLYGEAGNDTYVVDAAGDVVSEGTGQGTDTVLASVTYTLPSQVEHLTLTGMAAINGMGNGLANRLLGNDAPNVLDGKGGADLMAGGGGGDTYYVDSASDRVQEAPAAGADTVRSAISYTLPAEVESLVLLGNKGIGGTGNDLANVLTGNSAANTLDGRGGDDVLVGGAGNDLYRFDRGTGTDRIVENDPGSRNRDLLACGSDMLPIDLILERSASDLLVVLHRTTDAIVVQDWFKGPAYRVETIQAGDGSQLASAEVDKLIQAMASFSTSTGLSWEEALDERPEDVQTILAAHWQSAGR